MFQQSRLKLHIVLMLHSIFDRLSRENCPANSTTEAGWCIRPINRSYVRANKGYNKRQLSWEKWEAFWEKLQFMECCSLAQRQVESHDVLYLSLSVTLTFSFRDLFLDIIKEFPDVTDYIRKATSYREVRNALSNRGSRLISSEQI